jgi:hypothetical protein
LRIREETRRKRCACDVCYIKVNCDDNIFNFPRNSVLFCSLTSLIHTLELVGSNSHFEFKFKCFKKKKQKLNLGRRGRRLASLCCWPLFAACLRRRRRQTTAPGGISRRWQTTATGGISRRRHGGLRLTAAARGSRPASQQPGSQQPGSQQPASLQLAD